MLSIHPLWTPSSLNGHLSKQCWRLSKVRHTNFQEVQPGPYFTASNRHCCVQFPSTLYSDPLRHVVFEGNESKSTSCDQTVIWKSINEERNSRSDLKYADKSSQTWGCNHPVVTLHNLNLWDRGIGPHVHIGCLIGLNNVYCLTHIYQSQVKTVFKILWQKWINLSIAISE